MQIKEIPLKPLGGIELSKEETALLKWIRDAAWENIKGPDNSPYCKARVPEFYAGARLYRMQAGGASAGSLGALELFIRKLSLQGVIAKQALYPLEGHGSQQRTLSLRKRDLDNLRTHVDEEDE